MADLQMVSRESVVDDLRRFYDQEHIAVGAFACAHKDDCCADAARPLTHGAEAHVGTRYGEVLRVAVVSLDTGGGSDPIEKRTKIIEDLAGKKMNRHMTGTTTLLAALLGADIGDASPFPYFAMINAAKCAAHDERRDMVPASLYERCLPFGRSELDLLKPQVIVAQGNRARAVLPKGKRIDPKLLTDTIEREGLPAPVGTWLEALTNEYIRTVEVGENCAIALITPHPSARGGQWRRFASVNLAPVSWLVQILANALRL